MKKSLLVFIILTTFAAYGQGYAADYPTTGLIYNTKENSAMTFNCQKESDNTLSCEFTQTSVRHKAKPEDLSKKLEEAKKQFPDALKELSSEKSCEFMSTMLSVLEGKKTPEQAAESAPKEAISNKQQFIQGMKEMSKSKKDDLLVSMRALDEFCTTHSEESYLKVAKLEHEKETRTCTVSSNPFKQTFKWVADYASGAGAWVVQSKPNGPCGVVQLDRFEAVHTDSKLTFWKYYAKKAVTNPKGTVLPGFSCGDMDEREYIYDWKSDRDYKLGCEYIEFSVL